MLSLTYPSVTLHFPSREADNYPKAGIVREFQQDPVFQKLYILKTMGSDITFTAQAKECFYEIMTMVRLVI